MLSPDEIAAIAAVRAEVLPDRADVLRGGDPNDADDFGVPGPSQPPVTVAAAVPCRLGVPRSFMARQMAAKFTDQTTWEVAFAAGTDVRFGDQLVIAGRAFTVQNVLSSGAWETGRSAVVTEASS